MGNKSESTPPPCGFKSITNRHYCYGKTFTFLHGPQPEICHKIPSLPDCEMGNHGKGSMDHCSEREKEIGIHSQFILHSCLSSLNSSPSSDVVGLLTRNHINSVRDTLQPSPSAQYIFCLVRKAVWSRLVGRDIMWMQVERHEEKGRVFVPLLNKKSESWTVNGSVPSRWCGWHHQPWYNL